MELTQLLLYLITYGLIAMTFITLLPFDHWIVRVFDFPKVQLLSLCLILLIIFPFYFSLLTFVHLLTYGLLVLGILFHFARILPYTFLYPKEVIRCEEVDQTRTLSLIASNVLTSNTNYKLLLEQINKFKPDLVLTLESDEKWEKALEAIESSYPHSVKVPQDNYYGMHFYSKLKVKNLEVRYLYKEGIPSIKCEVQLLNKKWVHVYGLHPKPPSPTEAPSSKYRDAELLKVGEEVKKLDEPRIVFGDLNDVAWSKSTTLFRKISGLLDPRIGRGRYCTFYAKYKLLRWPLDHLFHSKDFCLIDLKVLKYVGSDHFPIFAKLLLSKSSKEQQEAPEARFEEKIQARQKIEKAE